MVRYRVKPDQAETNAQLVRAVYAELADTKPEGIRYATFRMEDGVTFIHVARLDAPEGENPLNDLAAFQRFTENIRDRCDEPPVATALDEVGSYNWL
jgi:hypothetical protein